MSKSSKLEARGAPQRVDRRRIVVLGLPTFALALSITTVTTYFPSVARQFTDSTALIGLVIASEGLLALSLPLVAGSWSDRLDTRIGGRLPFLVAGAPLAVLGLVAIGLVGSLWTSALALLLFFSAYYTIYEPYRALYPDTVPQAMMSRAQSVQALWRGAGTGLALTAGGALLALAQLAPFAAAAAVLVLAIGGFLVVLRRSGTPERPRSSGRVADQLRRLPRLVRDRSALRAFLIANALWELSLGAVKTFVVLYITQGVGLSLATSSMILGGAAVVVALAAGLSGSIGDRVGPARVVAAVVPIYGLGLVLPFFSQNPAIVLPAGAIVAFGGGVLMALPYALLTPLMPRGEHGALSGLYSTSRGVGIMLGPLLAGAAIELLRGPLAVTEGYAAMWLVASAAVLASLPLVLRVRRDERARADV